MSGMAEVAWGGHPDRLRGAEAGVMEDPQWEGNNRASGIVKHSWSFPVRSDCESPMVGCEIPDTHLLLGAEPWDEAQEGDLGVILKLARVPCVREIPVLGGSGPSMASGARDGFVPLCSAPGWPHLK